MDKNALIMDIGRLIASDPGVDTAPWDGYALIASYADGSRRLSGFRYRDDAAPEPATPDGAALLGERFDALRAATRVTDKAPWSACVMKIRRDTGRFAIDFEYDAPDRWDIGPDNVLEIAERARPAADA